MVNEFAPPRILTLLLLHKIHDCKSFLLLLLCRKLDGIPFSLPKASRGHSLSLMLQLLWNGCSDASTNRCYQRFIFLLLKECYKIVAAASNDLDLLVEFIHHRFLSTVNCFEEMKIKKKGRELLILPRNIVAQSYKLLASKMQKGSSSFDAIYKSCIL